MNNFIDSFVEYFIKGNVPENLGGDGYASGVFSAVSIDWEFPGAYGDDSSASYLKNIPNFKKFRDEDGKNKKEMLKYLR